MSKLLRVLPRSLDAASQVSRPRLAAMILGIVALAYALGWLHWQRASADLEVQLSDRFSLTEHVLSSEIGRLRHLPDVIAEDPRLLAALASPDPAQLAQANAFLKRLRGVSEAEEAYLIGLDGVTIAASNWDELGSYVGAHYGFRPYFLQAIERGQGQHYAVGVTTGRPGVFLSARTSDGRGVVVVKVSLDALEQAWARAGALSAVLDSDGVVFLSALAHWRFRPAEGLQPEVEARLAGERRYGGLTLGPPLEMSKGHLYEPALGQLRLWMGAVRGTDWKLMVALPVAPVREVSILVGIVAATAGFLALVFVLALLQRRQILQLRLQEADRLEHRVKERTQALAQEVEERIRTEAELRRTHESLVHAAKLAVLGRMSAAIVHEVGQSLSALDNNLAVAELHGRNGALVRLEEALLRSRRMVSRLQGVVTRLRSFGSRQAPAQMTNVAWGAVVAVACEIVQPRAKELGVRLTGPEAVLPHVLADAPRLEQVVTNLLLNAIEAAHAKGQSPKVWIECAAGALRICDNGAGIPPDQRQPRREPFSGERVGGMGLGLYLVQSLLEQMGGSLHFEDGQGGGTVAVVRLPLAASPSNTLRQHEDLV